MKYKLAKDVTVQAFQGLCWKCGVYLTTKKGSYMLEFSDLCYTNDGLVIVCRSCNTVNGIPKTMRD